MNILANILFILLILGLMAGVYYGIKLTTPEVKIEFSLQPYYLTTHELDKKEYVCNGEKREYYATIMTAQRLFGLPVVVEKKSVEENCE